MRKLWMGMLGLQTLVMPILIILAILSSFFLVRSSEPFPISENERRKVALEHLYALRHAVRVDNAAMRMQAIFPEGACFTLALYGLSWTNLVRGFDTENDLQRLAIEEATWALEQNSKSYVVAPFRDTQVHNGVFWLGQRNLLLGQLLQITPESDRSPEHVDEFHRNSESLANAFSASPTHHLDSYPGLCWPVDNVTALMSLLVHDGLYDTDYRRAYEEWKTWTQDHLDPSTKMPAAHLASGTGMLHSPARGCTNSWSLALLARMDPDFARQQYLQYREHFGIQRFGFRMFREYPPGFDFPADVDSGPIIWDAGVTATGVGLGAAIANGDLEMAKDIHDLANMWGFPEHVQVDGQTGKRYLLGHLPVGDAFLAWAYSLPKAETSMTTIPPSWHQIQTRSSFYLGVMAPFGLLSAHGILLLLSIRGMLGPCTGGDHA